MNQVRLKEAEERFLIRYPGGFANQEILQIAKKHKIEKMKKLAQDCFSPEQFTSAEQIVESMHKVSSQSSLISIFEKPRFRDVIKSLNANEKEHLAHGLKEFLHGDQAFGFRLITGLLQEYKLAKWPLVTVCSVYYHPDKEIFIKPTTTKGIIVHFELTGLKYNSTPTFEFYQAYREQLLQMKQSVDVSLQVDNAAFCGFLMMAMDKPL